MSQKKAQLLNPLNGNLNVTGVVTASSFVGGLTGDVTGTASLASNLTGTPDITVTNISAGIATLTGAISATDGTFSGNVNIGGTLTYQDVEHIDSVGIITAQQGIQVLANGLDVTGVSTFFSDVTVRSSDPTLELIDTDGSTTSSLSANSGNIFYSTSSSNRDHIFRGSTTEVVRITGDGNVGIGTDIPGANLHVQGATGGAGQIYVTDGDAAGTGNSFLISKGGTTTTLKDRQASSNLDFGSADTIAMRIDSSQRLLVGATTSGGSAFAGDANNLVIVESGNTAKIVVHRKTEDAYGGNLRLGKTRSSTNTIDNNDEVGIIEFFGHDSTDTNSRLAHIGCFAEADGANNDVPGRLVFATTADGASTPTERLRITSGGGFHFTNGELIERAKVTNGKLSDNTDIDLENGMVHLFTTTETTTSTPNIRINSSTSLNSVMATGEMISVTLITTAAAAGYSAQLTIDGGAVTENWTGGSAPSDGGSSGVDIYAYTIIKTADATFTVVATHTKTS